MLSQLKYKIADIQYDITLHGLRNGYKEYVTVNEVDGLIWIKLVSNDLTGIPVFEMVYTFAEVKKKNAQWFSQDILERWYNHLLAYADIAEEVMIENADAVTEKAGKIVINASVNQDSIFVEKGRHRLYLASKVGLSTAALLRNRPVILPNNIVEPVLYEKMPAAEIAKQIAV